MEPKVTTPVVKGIIISLILIVFAIITYLTGQMQNSTLGLIPYVVLIGGIIASCVIYSKQMQANVTFGNLFAHGFKVNAVVIVFQVLYTVLALKLIFPEMIDTVINTSRETMEKQGKLSDEQIEQATEMTRKYFMPFAIGGIIIMFGILGAIAAAVGAAVSKKNPQSPFNEPQG